MNRYHNVVVYLNIDFAHTICYIQQIAVEVTVLSNFYISDQITACSATPTDDCSANINGKNLCENGICVGK